MKKKRMDNKRIEEKAVTALKGILLRCPCLEPYIGSNDKTPSWDGTVFVYQNENHKKAYLLARVPIQVKGTENVLQKRASFSISVADLRNYYNDGGCLFFLVSGITSTGIGTVYFSELQVFDLEKILRTVGQKKTISVNLEEFPADNETEIQTIFANCAENRKKQTSFIGKTIVSLDQLLGEGHTINSLSLCTTCVGRSPDEVGRFISSHSSYIYAKLEGLDIDIPVDKAGSLVATRAVNEKVVVKGKAFYPSYRIEYKDGIPTIRIGKSISINADVKERSMTIYFNPSGTLNEQILDASYFVAIVEAQEIELNHARASLKSSNGIDIKRYKKVLQDYKDIQETLDYFGVTEELDLNTLSEKDSRNLRSLVDAIIYNKRIKFPKADGQVISGPFDVGNLSIWTWSIKQDTGDYKIENFFDNHSIVFFDTNDEKKANPIPVSHYLLLDKDAFMHTSNMNYASIEKSIKEMDHHPGIIERTTHLLLNILNAYDQRKDKDDCLLDLADAISDWISEGPNTVEPINRLNQLQIKKRRCPLTNKDIIELSKYTDERNETSIRCGAFLLLDDSAEAQKCFDQLTQNEQESFLTYPICFFGKLSVSQKGDKSISEDQVSETEPAL